MPELAQGAGHTCYSGFSPFLYLRKDGIMFQCGNENEFRFPTGKEKSEEGLLPNINSITTFQILSGWKYWLTGVTSIVLGLFGFLGNFFAIAVLWDEFL